LRAKEDSQVKVGDVLCEWDPHSIPIFAETGGKIRYEDLIEGETTRGEKDPSGRTRMVIMEHKGDLHPQIVVEDPKTGQILDFYYMPERAHLEVTEGQIIAPGTLVAKTPREASGHHGWSASSNRDFRGSQAKRSGRHCRDRWCGRAFGREETWEALDYCP